MAKDTKTQILVVAEENLEYFQDFIPKSNADHVIWQSSFIVLGAVQDGTSCGVLILGKQKQIAQIQWVYVAPDYRLQGIAGEMLTYVMQNAAVFGIRNIIGCYESLPAYYPLDRLFLGHDFSIETEKSYNYRLTAQDLITRPKFISAVNRYKRTLGKVSFYKLSEAPGYILRDSIINKEYKLEKYHQELSSIAVIGTELVGYLLMQEGADGNYHLEILETDGSNPMAALGLICASCKAGIDLINAGDILPDNVLTFENFGERGKGFAKNIFLMAPTETVWFHVVRCDELTGSAMENAYE